MFAIPVPNFTAEDTANTLVTRNIPIGDCQSTLLSYNGPQFCAHLPATKYTLLGVHKLMTSAYRPSGSGGVERVNHTWVQMLAMICNEHQKD